MKLFFGDTLNKGTEPFSNYCINLVSTESGTIVPRLMGHALHATKRKIEIHFDLCHLIPGKDGSLYMLVIIDDVSGYVLLVTAMYETLKRSQIHSLLISLHYKSCASGYQTKALTLRMNLSKTFRKFWKKRPLSPFLRYPAVVGLCNWFNESYWRKLDHCFQNFNLSRAVVRKYYRSEILDTSASLNWQFGKQSKYLRLFIVT